MPDLEGLGEEIKRLRDEQGLTPAELAQRSRVRIEDVHAIESGEQMPLRNVVVNIAGGLGASPTAFLRMLD
jgi:transcriptional regulator with XRE-family HTH domain